MQQLKQGKTKTQKSKFVNWRWRLQRLRFSLNGEILCGIYTGMNFEEKFPQCTSSIKKPRQLGQLYISIRIDGALSKKNFLKRMQKMTNQIRKEPKKIKKA